jgi:protein SCO1
MRDSAIQLQRRRILALAGLWAVPGAVPLAIAAEALTGWVRPRLPAPPLRLTAADGRKVSFAGVVAGKITAVQLMFTGCSSTCPTQGAFFAAVASRLSSTDTQLLSVSIDALGDTPATMSTWQARFGKSTSWLTSVADVADVDRLADFMKGTVGKSGVHTAQVFVFDRLGRLCYRTGDFPAISEIEALLARVAQLS